MSILCLLSHKLSHHDHTTAPGNNYSVNGCNGGRNCWIYVDVSYPVAWTDYYRDSLDATTFQTPIAVWNSALFIDGVVQTVYTNIDISNQQADGWQNISHNLNDLLFHATSGENGMDFTIQYYIQHQSSLYVPFTDEWSFDHPPTSLMKLDADTMNVSYYSWPYETEWQQICMVANEVSLYYLRSGSIYSLDFTSNTWTNEKFVELVPSACALNDKLAT